MYAESIWFDFKLVLFAVFICAACSPKLEIRDDLPDSAFECMQLHTPDGDPLIRTTGEPSPPSSFLTINDSKSALEWRLALIDSAHRSLEIQSLVWRTDETGTLLIRRVLQAANRGVDVRILIDDFDSPNWNHKAAVLTLHPNIEIRVFNPFKKLRGGWAQRGFELVTNLERLNHRMHNKLMLADNRAAIVGGRNIGNEYFGAGKSLDYRDYDVITIGPVIEELSDSFTVFWDSVWSYRISDLPKGEADAEKIDSLKAELDRTVMGSDWLNQEFDVSPGDWSDRIAAAKTQMITAPARAVFDCPPPEGDQFPVQTVVTLNKVVDQVRGEILMISPYVVPLEGFHAAIKEVARRGVTLRLLTNSLAAADHTIAFSGYKKNRVELLENGVTIYELRPDGDMWQQHRLPASKAKHISLHAKIYIFDQRWVYVGSLNLDPRAVHWNTEMGLLIDSRDLASRIYRDFSVDLSPVNSWRVEWRTPVSDKTDGRTRPELVWISGSDETTREPSRGIMQKINLWFFLLLPIEQQL